jgi:hypothetical protein
LFVHHDKPITFSQEQGTLFLQKSVRPAEPDARCHAYAHYKNARRLAMKVHARNVREFVGLSDEPEKRLMAKEFVKDELERHDPVPERTLPGSIRTFVNLR